MWRKDWKYGLIKRRWILFENLISNAMKYTPEYGMVRVSVQENKDTWKLEVKDTGIGISSKEHNKLFKMHFRGVNAINSKSQGVASGSC